MSEEEITPTPDVYKKLGRIELSEDEITSTPDVYEKLGRIELVAACFAIGVFCILFYLLLLLCPPLCRTKDTNLKNRCRRRELSRGDC